MGISKKLINIQNNARTRWIISTILSIFFLLAAVYIIKDETQIIILNNPTKIPFIQLINGDELYESRNFEAFFLPTKYNTKIKVHKHEKIIPYESINNINKPIFSEFDRLRIFRTFTTNLFTESEYWTISELPINRKSKAIHNCKIFIDRQIEKSSIQKIVEKKYNLQTKFLFNKMDINGYSK